MAMITLTDTDGISFDIDTAMIGVVVCNDLETCRLECKDGKKINIRGTVLDILDKIEKAARYEKSKNEKTNTV